MTRKNMGEKQGRSVSGHDAPDARIIVVSQREGVLFHCDRRRHAMAYLMGRGTAAAIYKRIASAVEIARELATHWPDGEDFPVIQTERL